MWAARKPARKRKFLFGGYYSLDRGPLMGTKVEAEKESQSKDYG